jgi:hypothetical protein
MRPALVNAIRAYPLLWIAVALGFVVAYHALLLATMVVRFGHAPNFITVYDVLESYRLTFTGTPSLRDALVIALGEPWLDVGFLSPQWKIAEWSLMILPPQFLLVSLVGCLIATYAVVRRATLNLPCPPLATPGSVLAVTLGTGLAGIANATLFWVVCCATPTWIVGLAMLGVSVSVAFLLEPLGPFLSAAGIGLLVWAIVRQLRRLTADTGTAHFYPLTLQRSV